MKTNAAFGVPDKIVSLIRKSYEGMSRAVVHGQQLSESFQTNSSETGLFAFACPVLACHRLDHERNQIPENEWHSIDTDGPSQPT